MDRVDTSTIRALRGPKGPKGDPGDGLKIDGKALDVSGLPVAPEEGAQWLVVDDLYSFIDGEWVNYGPLRGPQGVPGPGVAHVGTLPPAVSDLGTLWFDPNAQNADGYLLLEVGEGIDGGSPDTSFNFSSFVVDGGTP